MKLAKLNDPLDKQIRELHQKAHRWAGNAVKAALQCGALLNKKRERVEYGEWYPYLEMLGITPETARRYMQCAERFKLEGGKANAKTLMDLYRAYGLLPELAGGGARNGKDPAGPANGQLFFDFNLFGGFMRVIDATKENPFAAVDRAELESVRVQTAKALELIDEAMEAAK